MNRELVLKTGVVLILAMLLMVPVSMVEQLVGERQMRRDQAVASIAEGWGGRQVVAGPLLVVPYKRTWTEVTRQLVNGAPSELRVDRTEEGVLRFAPEKLDWQGELATEEKARGIHKARLYAGKLAARGTFALPAELARPDASSRWEFGDARVVVGIADARGIRRVADLQWAGRTAPFQPGTGGSAFDDGVHATVGRVDVREADASRRTDTDAPRRFDFNLSLELAGTEAFALAPSGRDTSVSLHADWPHPSFHGPFLPVSHRIGSQGFAAEWRISQFAARNATLVGPCVHGKTPCQVPVGDALGVSLVEPVGTYQQLDRATKYGFLFIGLLFASFFLYELLRRLAIHPIQYTLVGLALATFYLLLTALSEHMAFGLAYAIATVACVGIVTIYVVRVLRGRAAGLAFGGALAALYGALFLLLKAEDYALLAGALLVFALLAAVMIGTRRVDWYRLTATRTA